MSDSEIEILLSSDCEYEKIVVEIFCAGKFVALLNQDDGPDNLKVEFPAPDIDDTKILRTIDLITLERALKLAKEKIQG